MNTAITVRPLREDDLTEADRVLRLAFGTFLSVADPASFRDETDYVGTRWRADPTAAFAAEWGGDLIGSVFVAHWGSVGFFGPLTVRPDYWDRGVAQRLIEPVLDRFAAWGTSLTGLYTFAQSPKHLGLYQKFGFWPRQLTTIMSRPIGPADRSGQASHYSTVVEGERADCLAACRQLTSTLYDGLDVSGEIRAVAAQGLGDTVLLWGVSGLDGLAVCHVGPGTEAGSGTCYVKFAAARPGGDAARNFGVLLDACAALGAGRGASTLTGGVNTARSEAYRIMLERGFRIAMLGVAMHRPDAPGYSRPGIFAIDDWR